ncbi:MAG: site-specific integrase [Colwellia sp.]|nr:tyrosine-type recombinase/integrase [Colwellia sp.]NQZ83289.1 site-specific integrase [Colwellia sp.]
MKKRSIGKLTQRNINELGLRKTGQAEVGYYGEDKRILAVPTQTGISIVVQLNCNNKRYSFKVGDIRDHKLAVLLKRAHDYIADIVNTRYHIHSKKTVRDSYDEIVLPYSLANHKDSLGFQQRLATLIAEFGHMPVCDITKSDIQRLLNYLAKGRQSPTVARYYAAYSKFFSLIVEQEIIDKNPCSTIKKPKENPSRDRVLSDEEAIAFVDAAINDLNPIHGLSLALSATTGLRQGNIRSIQLCWLNHDVTVLNIPDSKSGKPIRHYLSPISADIIQLAVATSCSKYLFPSRVPRKYMSKPSKCIARIRRKVQKVTGITEHFYAHDCRRTYASTQLRITGDINIVRESMSHADVKTTLIYAHNHQQKLLEANTKTSEALLGGRKVASFIKHIEE